MNLAYRSGQVRNIQARTVYEADAFEFEYGSNQFLRHRPASGAKGAPAYYWASYTTPDGGFNFEVMSREEAEEHAKQYSQAYKSGGSPWTTSFDEMAKKTVLKKLLKLAPLSAELAQAVETDGLKNNLVMSQDAGATIQTARVVEPEPASQTGGLVVDASTGEVVGKTPLEAESARKA